MVSFAPFRFLEHSQVWQNAYGSEDGSGEAPTPSYEMELQTLHEMIQQTVATLITDPQSLVRRTLLENGITKLCVFFGKQKGKYLTFRTNIFKLSSDQ